MSQSTSSTAAPAEAATAATVAGTATAVAMARPAPLEASAVNAPNATTSPTNPLVSALLTDLYQITMAYAYWKNGRHEDPAVFELFFRKNPFGGEFTIFAGLDECLKYIAHLHFSASDIEYLRTGVPALSRCDAGFFEWLSNLDASQVTVRAMADGTVCFPREPLIIIEAPLAVGQLLETTLLTLVNYPSLVATNAARMVLAAKGKNTSPAAVASKDDNNENVDLLLPAQCLKPAVCVEF